MPKIHILDAHEALKIAAGEVIERPAHIIKELIENSLDAGAKAITLSFERAGKTLISVADDGCGMDKQDAEACFLPHATSKITKLNDLENVLTFGFRGEALASISAVARVELITRSADETVGTRVVYDQSALVESQDVPAALGTTVIITQLFEKIPVRKKFLKTDETEWNAIYTCIQAFCFAYPQVHFKVFHNNKMVLSAPSVSQLIDRIHQVWDVPNSQLLSVESEDKKISIRGVISHTTLWRYGRNHLYFFVNNRWVKNSELSKGLLKGYAGALPPEKFPLAVIFVSVPAQDIDVNVHPKKEEVKFAHPGVIQTLVTHTTKSTLEHGVTQAITPASHQTNYQQAPSKAFIDTTVAMQPWSNSAVAPVAFSYTSAPAETTYQPPLAQSMISPSKKDSSALLVQEHLETQQTTVQDKQNAMTVIGQLMATYILCQSNQGLVIVDQHAAHERILYEKFSTSFYKQDGTLLLFPEVLTLTQSQVSALMRYKDFFAQQGIDFDDLGSREIVIRSCPPFVKGPSVHDFFQKALAFIDEHSALDTTLFDTTFNNFLRGEMACKAAVKAGDKLTPQQMQQLLDDLATCNNRFKCVHGRPTLWSIDKQQLEKTFRRIQS